MAKFTLELPSTVIEEMQFVDKNAERIFGAMTTAGAKVVESEIRGRLPNSKLVDKVHMTRVYKTPTDGGINTKVYISGYIPFSDPNRKYFARRGKNGGKVYRTSKGVPAEFIANLYEYGRSTSPFPKKPFLRKAFGQTAKIKRAMLEEQKTASGGILDDD